ncbi:MAG: hypothetical protein Q8R02_23600 [Hyphomonadaceae bacterium]|nr:hypothetical protein [Hyphomonadaceae bacterium]
MTPPPRTACLVFAAFLAACTTPSKPVYKMTLAAPARDEPTLAEVRTATERFRDVNVALAEGYIRDPFDLCDSAEMMGKPKELGAMGIHYFRPDLVGVSEPPNPRVNGNGTHTDFLKPSILIYEPQKDGSLSLVAVENLVFIKAWEAGGAKDRPSFHGVPWDKMADDPATAIDEAHMFEPHYDRHVWLYRDNPNGVFTPFNPAVNCQHHTGAKKHVMPPQTAGTEPDRFDVANAMPPPMHGASHSHSH